MTVTRILVLTLAIVLPIVALGQAPVAPQANDLQGTWRLLSLEYGGKKTSMGGESFVPGRLIIVGNKFTYMVGDEKAGEGTIRVDANQSPRVVDASGKYFDKEEGFLEWVGIYKIEGDQLWLCGRFTGGKIRPAPPEERPTEFRTVWGDEAALGIFQRERP